MLNAKNCEDVMLTIIVLIVTIEQDSKKANRKKLSHNLFSTHTPFSNCKHFDKFYYINCYCHVCFVLFCFTPFKKL